MNRHTLICAGPYTLKVLKEGQDISAAVGLREVRYMPDGSGTRTMADGTVLPARWRFLDAGQTLVETSTAKGSHRFRIVELSEEIYRKIDIDSGIEFQQFPLRR